MAIQSDFLSKICDLSEQVETLQRLSSSISGHDLDVIQVMVLEKAGELKNLSLSTLKVFELQHVHSYARSTSHHHQKYPTKTSTPAPCVSFPQRLKHAMKAAGLTQKELAERAGVSQSVISRLITGKDKTGTRSGVLSHALGVNFDWLHYGTGEMYSANFSADNCEV